MATRNESIRLQDQVRQLRRELAQVKAQVREARQARATQQAQHTQQHASATPAVPSVDATRQATPATSAAPARIGLATLRGTAQDLARAAMNEIIARYGGKLPTLPKRPTRNAVPLERKAWWRAPACDDGATAELTVTDRLLDNIDVGVTWTELPAYLKEPTRPPVIVYGTSGAGKTRLMLEYLHGHWGYYLPAVASPVAGAVPDNLLAGSLAALRDGNVFAADVYMYVLLPILCRALVLEQLWGKFGDRVSPKHWLQIQLQGHHSPTFERLCKQLDGLDQDYHTWVRMVKAMHDNRAERMCVFVDEAQALLAIRVIPSARKQPGDPGWRSAYGVAVRTAHHVDLGVVMAGTGMSLADARLESRGSGSGVDALVLQVCTVFSTKHAMEYLGETLWEYEDVVNRPCVQSALTHHVGAWFNKARPRFVVRLADELELLFRRDDFGERTDEEQAQAICDVAHMVVWYVTNRLRHYFAERNERHRLSPVVRGLLAQRLAAFTFRAIDTPLDELDDTSGELHDMVESGFVSLNDGGHLVEPIAARALSDWLGANEPVRHVRALLNRTHEPSAQGPVFESLVCASVCAQFREAALAVQPDLAWNLERCPFVPVDQVPWVRALFPSKFLDTVDAVRLAGVEEFSQLMVEEERSGLNVGTFLKRPVAPFFLPQKSAGPDIVFQLEFHTPSGGVILVNVLLQCKLTPSSAVSASAWATVIPSNLYMAKRSSTPVVNGAKAHKESTWVARTRCLGAVVSYPKTVPDIPTTVVGSDLLMLAKVDGGIVAQVMGAPVARTCKCPKGCSRGCGCRQRQQVCGASCRCQTWNYAGVACTNLQPSRKRQRRRKCTWCAHAWCSRHSRPWLANQCA